MKPIPATRGLSTEVSGNKQLLAVRCSQQLQTQNIPKVGKLGSYFSLRATLQKYDFQGSSGFQRGGVLDKGHGLHRMLFLRVSLNLQFHLLCVTPKAIFSALFLRFYSSVLLLLVGLGAGGSGGLGAGGLVGRISR